MRLKFCPQPTFDWFCLKIKFDSDFGLGSSVSNKILLFKRVFFRLGILRVGVESVRSPQQALVPLQTSTHVFFSSMGKIETCQNTYAQISNSNQRKIFICNNFKINIHLDSLKKILSIYSSKEL